MSIDAKRIDAAGDVITIQLPDDPSDVDLIKVLGGKGDLVTRGWIKEWEVLTADGTTTLVVGRPPPISSAPKRRTSCNLTDSQVMKLVKLVNDGWAIA
jgi:hypothetical protein